MSGGVFNSGCTNATTAERIAFEAVASLLDGFHVNVIAMGEQGCFSFIGLYLPIFIVLFLMAFRVGCPPNANVGNFKGRHKTD